MPRSRKLIAVSEDVVNEIAAVARRLGMTTSELVEAILTQALGVLRVREDVGRVLSDAVLYSDLRRVGGVLIPRSVFFHLIDSVDDGSFEQVLSEEERLVKWFFTSVRIKRVELDHAELAKLISIWLPGFIVDVRSSSGRTLVVVSSPEIEGDRRLEFVKRIVVSALESLGAKIGSVEMGVGVVSVSVEGWG